MQSEGSVKTKFNQVAPFVVASLLVSSLNSPVALADEFRSEPGPPTLSEIVLTENDDATFTSIQPAWSFSTDRYNVETSIGLPGGHDDLVGLEMCWYLLDFSDCDDSQKIENEPETVFKATHSVTRIGDVDTAIDGESFQVVGSNNYRVNESETTADSEADGSANVDVTFTFRASNAMRSSNNWKVYIEAEDRQGNTGAISRDGVRVDYFAQMTTERQDVNFGAAKKGETNQVDNIDSGKYTANAQSQFFIDADDFSAGTGKDLPILQSGQLGANQVELKCARSATYDSDTAQLVTNSETSFGEPFSPTSEEPVDADNHSCAVRFGQGQANNPNLLYTNTFTLAIGAADVNAPRNLDAEASGGDDTTERKISFDPPEPVVSGAATLESYRIDVVNVTESTTEQTVRVTVDQLEAGSNPDFTYSDATSRVSAVFSSLSPDNSYQFVVEANTSIGFGSATSNQSSTEADELYSFTTATFTSNGKTGPDGPELPDLRNGVSGPSWPLENLQKGAYTGQILWTVPADGTYQIEAFGAKGVGGSKGARMRGDFNLSQGEKLRMVVGQNATYQSLSYTYAGGGGTFVAKQDYTPLIVAAGSGGRGSAGSASIGSDSAGIDCASGAGFSDNGSSSNTGSAAKSFKNGATGGAVSNATGAGGFGGGGGGQKDGSLSDNDNGGGGGYQGGDGACNSFGKGGLSYNDGSNQSNSTGGNDLNYGRIVITKQ